MNDVSELYRENASAALNSFILGQATVEVEKKENMISIFSEMLPSLVPLGERLMNPDVLSRVIYMYVTWNLQKLKKSNNTYCCCLTTTFGLPVEGCIMFSQA